MAEPLITAPDNALVSPGVLSVKVILSLGVMYKAWLPRSGLSADLVATLNIAAKVSVTSYSNLKAPFFYQGRIQFFITVTGYIEEVNVLVVKSRGYFTGNDRLLCANAPETATVARRPRIIFFIR